MALDEDDKTAMREAARQLNEINKKRAEWEAEERRADEQEKRDASDKN